MIGYNENKNTFSNYQCNSFQLLSLKLKLANIELFPQAIFYMKVLLNIVGCVLLAIGLVSMVTPIPDG
jgi:hypothetical protein